MPPLRVWWIVWGATLASLAAIWWSASLVQPAPSPAHKNPFVDLASLVPLFVSIVVRWLVLPRYTDGARAFVVFVAGIALAEAAGIVGIFLGGPYRDDLFLLGALGILQFVPLYAKRLQEPKPEGFIPNN